MLKFNMSIEDIFNSKDALSILFLIFGGLSIILTSGYILNKQQREIDYTISRILESYKNIIKKSLYVSAD